MVIVALLLGLLGLGIHVLWFGSVIVMAILVGLMASDLRSGGSVISGLATTVADEVRGLANDVSRPSELDAD
jgi:hypothetical protein